MASAGQENLRGEIQDSRFDSTDSMRISAVWQRNLPGAFTSPAISASRPLVSYTRTSGTTRSRAQFHIKSDPRVHLSDFFDRVRWPTTPAEERELVEGVRTAIWEGHNGGNRHQKPSIVISLLTKEADK